MERLRRKIDTVLVNWKNTPNHMPLIIKGARQIGKTEAVRHFAFGHYKSVVEINFVLQNSTGIFLTMDLRWVPSLKIFPCGIPTLNFSPVKR